MKKIVKNIILPCFACLLFLPLVSNCTPPSKNGGLTKSELRDTSKFLAGIKIEKRSKLYNLTKNENYYSYREQINLSWNCFQESNLKEIEKWVDANIPKNYNSTVFYPFSGPDIINLIAFFPDSDKYIMFGLEPIGDIPQPKILLGFELYLALDGLKNSLSNFLRWNFFKTKKMEKNICTSYFNGIIGIMMFMLARYGYDVNEVKKIWVDSDGNIRYTDRGIGPEIAITGCEISFNGKNNLQDKKIQYFQLDVRNSSLRQHTNFIHYLKDQERFATLIKAATYLMHFENHSFTVMRSLILKRSNLILQDDSGIPLNSFFEDDWALSFYGTYNRPIPLFDNRYQPRLYRRIKEQSKGTLPFTYGYYISPGSSNLTLALRNID